MRTEMREPDLLRRSATAPIRDSGEEGLWSNSSCDGNSYKGSRHATDLPRTSAWEKKYGPAEAKTSDRLFGIRKERVQQRIDIRLEQHFAEIGPCRAVNGDGRRRKCATVRGEETHWREEKPSRQ